jgi:hypothetical protein
LSIKFRGLEPVRTASPPLRSGIVVCFQWRISGTPSAAPRSLNCPNDVNGDRRWGCATAPDLVPPVPSSRDVWASSRNSRPYDVFPVGSPLKGQNLGGLRGLGGSSLGDEAALPAPRQRARVRSA